MTGRGSTITVPEPTPDALLRAVRDEVLRLYRTTGARRHQATLSPTTMTLLDIAFTDHERPRGEHYEALTMRWGHVTFHPDPAFPEGVILLTDADGAAMAGESGG